MAGEMPGLYQELLELRKALELHFKEVQDFEFTIEEGVAVLPSDSKWKDECNRNGQNICRDGA
jgi:hypothetical protein